MSEITRCGVCDEILIFDDRHKNVLICSYSGDVFYHKHCWLAKNEKLGVDLD